MIRERRGIEVVAFFSSSTHFIHLLSSLLIIVIFSLSLCFILYLYWQISSGKIEFSQGQYLYTHLFVYM